MGIAGWQAAFGLLNSQAFIKLPSGSLISHLPIGCTYFSCVLSQMLKHLVLSPVINLWILTALLCLENIKFWMTFHYFWLIFLSKTHKYTTYFEYLQHFDNNTEVLGMERLCLTEYDFLPILQHLSDKEFCILGHDDVKQTIYVKQKQNKEIMQCTSKNLVSIIINKLGWQMLHE